MFTCSSAGLLLERPRWHAETGATLSEGGLESDQHLGSAGMAAKQKQTLYN